MRKRTISLIGVLVTVPLLMLLAGCPKPVHVDFKNPACLLPDEGYRYKLCEPFKLKINHQDYSVPEDFITDLASIPQPLWNVYSPHHTDYIEAAVVHDYLYCCDKKYNRFDADSIFYNILLMDGVPQYRAYIFFLGVRLFGRKHYDAQ